MIKELEPKEVWSIFDEITKVPRPSKKEEKIREYLKNFAQKHSLECREDAKGNIVIAAPATPGYEQKPGYVLQSHMDMVCEKEPFSTHNFETDAIETQIVDGWVKANNTTLGADCGIGMALQLAALSCPDVEHPALEALFTVDEEQGLSGAFELGEGMLTHKLMLNLDSEDEGEIFIGCAGGIDTVAQYELKYDDIIESDFKMYQISIGALKGGHSGDDIEKGRANANKLMARMLWQLNIECGVRVLSVDGGNLRNAIAREAVATVLVPGGVVAIAKEVFDEVAAKFRAEYAVTEPNMALGFEAQEGSSDKAVNKELLKSLLRALLAVDNGVVAMSSTMPGMVETSTNLASVKFKENIIEVVLSQRSSVESAKEYIALSVESVFELSGAKVIHSDGYPGWTPNPSSELVKRSAEIYEKLFNVKPAVKAIHAGLECGLILAKYPGIDVVSVGPTIRDAHSPSEKLNIQSVANYWTYLKALLA